MLAQPSKLVVNDYLKEVRVFPPGSSDFIEIASELGVSATLSTLGEGQNLVAAVRNDSGGAVGLRILIQLTKDGKTSARDLELGRALAAGGVTLVAPREIQGALTRLMMVSGTGSMMSRITSAGSPTVQPLDDYQGATAVTVSIDSATLADGRFIGADTQKFFDQLVAEDTAKRSFFADLAAQSKTLTNSELQQVLIARQSAADAAKGKATSLANFNLAAMTEFSLSTQALMRLARGSGLSNLSSWAEHENVKLSSQPTLHR